MNSISDGASVGEALLVLACRFVWILLAAWAFGSWQKSFDAGYFMFLALIVLAPSGK